MRMEQNPQDAEKILTTLLEAPAPERIKKNGAIGNGAHGPAVEPVREKRSKCWPNTCSDIRRILTSLRCYCARGCFFRRMGAPNQALSKFYAVMGTSLNLKAEHFNFYRRLVLQAQAEIADTFYLQGRFDEAIEKYQTVLKEQAPDLNRAEIRYKLVRSYAALNKTMELASQAEVIPQRIFGRERSRRGAVSTGIGIETVEPSRRIAKTSAFVTAGQKPILPPSHQRLGILAAKNRQRNRQSALQGRKLHRRSGHL